MSGAAEEMGLGTYAFPQAEEKRGPMVRVWVPSIPRDLPFHGRVEKDAPYGHVPRGVMVVRSEG